MSSYTVTTMDDYHAVYTITLNELIACSAVSTGSDETTGLMYGWPLYSDEQGARVVSQIVGEYGWREIGITPIKLWIANYRSVMSRTAQTANLLYPLIDVDISELSGGGYKERVREIASEFPQTMLSQYNSDYATRGNDHVTERVEQLNSLDIIKVMKDIAEDVVSVDELFITAIDKLFMHTFTPIVNGF